MAEESPAIAKVEFIFRLFTPNAASFSIWTWKSVKQSPFCLSHEHLVIP